MSEVLIGLTAAALAILFAYVPGFKTAFDKLDSHPNGKQYKQLIMLGLLAAVTGIAVALSCFSPYSTYACDSTGFWAAGYDFVVAIAVNQGVYKGTKYLGKGGPDG